MKDQTKPLCLCLVSAPCWASWWAMTFWEKLISDMHLAVCAFWCQLQLLCAWCMCGRRSALPGELEILVDTRDGCLWLLMKCEKGPTVCQLCPIPLGIRYRGAE